MRKDYFIKGDDNKRLLLSVLSVNSMEDVINNHTLIVSGVYGIDIDRDLTTREPDTERGKDGMTREQAIEIVIAESNWFSEKHSVDITKMVLHLINCVDLKKISNYGDSIYISVDKFIFGIGVMGDFFWKMVDDGFKVIEEYNYDDFVKNFIYYSSNNIFSEVKLKVNMFYTEVLNYLRDEIILKSKAIDDFVEDQYSFYIGEIHIIMSEPTFNQYNFSNDLIKIKQILNWSNIELKYTAGNFNSEVVFHLKEKVNFIKTFSQLLSNNINVVGFSMDLIPEVKIIFSLKDYKLKTFGFLNNTIISKYNKNNFYSSISDFLYSFIETPIDEKYFRYPKQM